MTKKIKYCHLKKKEREFCKLKMVWASIYLGIYACGLRSSLLKTGAILLCETS